MSVQGRCEILLSQCVTCSQMGGPAEGGTEQIPGAPCSVGFVVRPSGSGG